MDNEKITTERTQEAQEDTGKDYPFIVEITAAMLTDAFSLEESKRQIKDSDFLEDLPALIQSVLGLVYESNRKEPELQREKSAFYKSVYDAIPGYKPEIDPESGAFNIDAYNEEINEYGQEAFIWDVADAYKRMIREQTFFQAILPDLKGLAYEVQKAVAKAVEVTNSDELREHIVKTINRERANRAKAATAAARKLAEEKGAIMTLGHHVATPTHTFRDGLTASKIKSLPGQFSDFEFDSSGRLNMLSLNDQKLETLPEQQTGFLMALLQAAMTDFDLRENNSSKGNSVITLYLPTILREFEIDPRPHDRAPAGSENKYMDRPDVPLPELRRNKFLEFIKPIDNRVGTIPGEGSYAVARFLSWDQKSETITIAIPYIMKVAEMSRKEKAITSVFHADIMTENPVFVELANRIVVGLIELGVTTPNVHRKQSQVKTKTGDFIIIPEKDPRSFKWESKFSTLISKCPQLQSEIESIRGEQIERDETGKIIKGGNKSQRINKKLHDAFTAAIRIILEKSDAPQYYQNFKIEPMTRPAKGSQQAPAFMCPTNSTLNDRIIITHNGKNPDYKTQV